ncbi:conserved hypothetical protein [Perkinsus marinus ATCC 50983]|uniref:Uncharacterized protein n=1 Tax=Perkinsus marinus (strain ATCC 50983 / TXsc) TaxID=423536 RepID=C5LLT5_PERM5|nr:conserved hypothetical protein [Perkinsus marinus ATCC 50983]EER02307.1 conserved hypothetical protein [Perkinsus marinus ATCC 50983]|eukprot:XP_002769589.1 conserved hypothetical protein [Perkinsus marinus ATCC 50983]
MLSLAVTNNRNTFSVSPPASPNLSPARPRPAVSIIREETSSVDYQTQQFLRRVCRCNSSDAAIFLTQVRDDDDKHNCNFSRPRNMTSDGDFFAHPSHSSVNTTDKGSKESPVTCTDTDGSVTAPSTGVVSCLPHNESQASLMTLVGIADDNDDRHVCCDGNVSMRVDADEEFLQEFVFGTSAFQVDFVATLAKSVLEMISPAEIVAFPDIPLNLRGVTRFYSLRPPSISIHAYLKRLEKHFMCSRECYLIALIYLDRISKNYSEFRITRRSVHKFFLAALVIAVKYFDDLYYDNKFYAHVGGVRVAELDVMEAAFLQLIDWHLFVPGDEFALCAKRFLMMGCRPASTEGPVDL